MKFASFFLKKRIFPRNLTNIVYENILSLTQLLVDKLVHNLNNISLIKP